MLGAVVNTRPTLPRPERDALRALLHNCARHSWTTQTRGHDPVTFREPALPPVLLYPIDHEPISFLTRAARGTGPTEEVLRRLFGGTRAAVLRALSDRVHTTGGIARSLGISIASASEHASLLRAAGLVASERCGNTVQHWLTPLGLEFLGQTS